MDKKQELDFDNLRAVYAAYDSLSCATFQDANHLSTVLGVLNRLFLQYLDNLEQVYHDVTE